MNSEARRKFEKFCRSVDKTAEGASHKKRGFGESEFGVFPPVPVPHIKLRRMR